MSQELTKQELHNLAMNIVGEELKSQGYEFMGVNSDLSKNPQFVTLKDKKLHFIIVRSISYPNNVNDYNSDLIMSIQEQATKFEAKTFYAGVGLGHGSDYSKPVLKDEDYTMIYNGLKEML
jgi:hypothetical protein